MVAVAEYKERHASNVALTIRQLTNQGDKLAHALMAIIDNPQESTSDRLTAIKVAYDRGWGKAPIEIHVEHETTNVLKVYDVAELLKLKAAIQVADAQGSASPALVEATVLEPDSQE